MPARTLILFKSRHGTTAKAANALAELLGAGHTQIVDLSVSAAPDLNAFDTVIVGGSIHIGKIQGRIRRFCRKHESELLRKRLGLFISHMDKEHPQDEFDRAFPEKLRQHATATGLFGGEFLFEKMNALQRAIVRRVSGATKSVSQIDHDAIREFARRMNAPG